MGLKDKLILRFSITSLILVDSQVVRDGGAGLHVLCIILYIIP